jgi:hypothetical protein
MSSIAELKDMYPETERMLKECDTEKLIEIMKKDPHIADEVDLLIHQAAIGNVPAASGILEDLKKYANEKSIILPQNNLDDIELMMYARGIDSELRLATYHARHGMKSAIDYSIGEALEYASKIGFDISKKVEEIKGMLKD